MSDYTGLTIRSGQLDYFFPNSMGQVLLLAMEEILGRSGLDAVLNHAGLSEYLNAYPHWDLDKKFPFTHISHLQAGLEMVYGSYAGRGLALRVGRACFKPGLHAFGTELGLVGQSFHLLPLQARLKTAMEAFATLFNTQTDQPVRLESDEKYIYWIIERCPFCWERQSEVASCYLAVGLLQEALYWVSGGRYFTVREEKCIACGDEACIIRIDRIPMS